MVEAASGFQPGVTIARDIYDRFSVRHPALLGGNSWQEAQYVVFFLVNLHRETVGEAYFTEVQGIHCERAWVNRCWFSLMQWAEHLHQAPLQVYAVLQALTQAHIIVFQPFSWSDEEGALSWNLALDQWQSLPLLTLHHMAAKTSRPATIRELRHRLQALHGRGKTGGDKTRLPTHEWNSLRRQVFERDAYTCQYCGAGTCALTCDHIIPLTRGGSSDIANLITACQTCNSGKGNRTIDEWLLTLPTA